MNILEVYKKYQIMPNLAEHQLKVAAVAEIILNHSSLILDGDSIIAACLLHDMGNIIKFDLTKSLFNLNLNLTYWQKVKENFIEKYGSDEHVAHLAIIKELGVSERVTELVDSVGFTKGVKNLETPDFGRKICSYCDMRVGPFGIVSLEQRFEDLHQRYAHRHQEWGADDRRKEFENAILEIEKQIFEHCNIKPEEVTETAIAERKQQLKNFEI